MKYVEPCDFGEMVFIVDNHSKNETYVDGKLLDSEEVPRRLDGEEIVLAVICDGMGGLTNGELASAEAVHSLAGWFREKMEELAEQEDFEDELYELGNSCLNRCMSD